VIDESADETFKKKKIVFELNRKVSSQELENLSKKIKSENTKYERLFLAYMLPSMTQGFGYWATVDFLPNMEAKIQGLSIEEEAKIKDIAQKIENKKSTWIEHSMAKAFVLCEKGGNLTMKIIYRDGGTSEEKNLVGDKNRIYDKESFAQHGEYYVIADNGTLEFYNKEGKKFTTAQPIK
jgi:hypothetical protein